MEYKENMFYNILLNNLHSHQIDVQNLNPISVKMC